MPKLAENLAAARWRRGEGPSHVTGARAGASPGSERQLAPCAGPSLGESEIKQNITAHSMLDFGGSRGQRCPGVSAPSAGES